MSSGFMFSVGMLADMMGGNPQYLSKKVKRMVDDPEIKLQTVLKSNKEGYQIPEEEVLRCFGKVTPGQIRAYKERYLESASPKPKVRKLTEAKTQPQGYLEEENERLIAWKVHMAATAPEKKHTKEMREYLEGELRKISDMKKEASAAKEVKLKEYNLLELLEGNCDRMMAEIMEQLKEKYE